MDLHHAEAHLPAVVIVVGLTVSPVKPLHSLVSCRPEPLTRVVLTVTLLQVRKSNISGHLLLFGEIFPHRKYKGE